jgi:hypothetical protein
MENTTKPNSPQRPMVTGTAAIRQKLEAAKGQWVSALELNRIAIEYKRPIHTLRWQHRITIENRVVRVNGRVHGYYRIPRYAGEPAPPLPEAPSKAGRKSQCFVYGSAAKQVTTGKSQQFVEYETGVRR